jgi:hypothetical protein
MTFFESRLPNVFDGTPDIQIGAPNTSPLLPKKLMTPLSPKYRSLAPEHRHTLVLTIVRASCGRYFAVPSKVAATCQVVRL